MQSYPLPEITIIIPVWNGLAFIKECLESVYLQTCTCWEILIGDNGSTDGTREYLSTLKDERIRIFYHKQNLGIAGNLNFLFSKSNAPICQILCSDDYFLDQHSLKTILAFWSAAPANIGFAFACNEAVHSSLMSFERECLPRFIMPDTAAEFFFLFGNIPGNLSNVSLRASIFEQCGQLDEDYKSALDYEYWSRISQKVGIGVISESVTMIRRHDNTASVYLNKRGDVIVEKQQILNRLYLLLKEKYPHQSFFLKLHATLAYDSFYRQIGIKNLLKGQPEVIRFLHNHQQADFLLPSIIKWGVFIASAGGRFGLVWSAKLLRQDFMSKKVAPKENKLCSSVSEMV